MKGLYAIVDPEACAGRDAALVARAILRGGCAALQLRAKHLSDAAYEALALSLAPACRAAGVMFVVNDRVWLAERVQADAVHLGQSDTPLAEARARLPAHIKLGLSTHSLAQALQAQLLGADMIGFGPVFPTTSKEAPSPIVGLAQLAEVCSAVRLPVIAIGGIGLHNVIDVAASGAKLAAAISALCAAPEPQDAARHMHAALRDAS